MKKTIKSTISALLVIICLFSFTACGNSAEKAGLWENAIYSNDTYLGEGAKTVAVEVQAEEKTVIFTIKTDKQTVGDALSEHNLIDGDQGEYGLYIKAVNGITADFNVDKSYWAFYVNGEYATSGVDATKIEKGAKYQLVYTK